MNDPKREYVVVLACAAWLLGYYAPAQPALSGETTKTTCYYVSPDGNDNNAGTKQSPWKTIIRAQEVIRENRGDPSGDVTVYLRGGVYYLYEPLVLTPVDSGTKGSRRVFKALPGEKPVFSGGERLANGRVDTNGRWCFSLPEVRAGRWSFCQLFVNGQRCLRPRLPKEGYYQVSDALPPRNPPEIPIGPTGQDQFVYEADNFSPRWTNLSDVETVALHLWSASRLRVAGVDGERRIVQFTGPTYHPDFLGLGKGTRYWIENVREELTEPGQWYLDRITGELVYLPKQGEILDSAEIVAPRLNRLVEFRGDPTNHEWVEHIAFEGITFTHANYVLPPEGQSIGQAECILGGAIYGLGSQHCILKDCAVEHVGNYAVEWSDGCHENKLLNCELTDLGGGGVKIGRQMPYGYDVHEVASHNHVHNCLIARGGRIHPGAVGILVLSSHHNRIEHNEVTDFYYSGISVGLWGGENFPNTWAHHNSIVWNHIHKIGQEVLGDMAGIYAMGGGAGTVIRNNVIHGVQDQKINNGGFGIYMDEGASYITIENNLCYDVSDQGFYQNYGRENVVRNNVFFARGGANGVSLCRHVGKKDRGVILERNIIVTQDQPPVAASIDMLKKPIVISDNNLYWIAHNPQPLFAKDLTLAQRQTQGQDLHSLFADPRFVDAAQGDFHLQADSPAFALGFDAFNYALAGRQATGNEN